MPGDAGSYLPARSPPAARQSSGSGEEGLVDTVLILKSCARDCILKQFIGIIGALCMYVYFFFPVCGG